MIYKSFGDLTLSALGMGCMRLPCKEGGNADIDMETTREMVAYAMANGVNYYDTAWGYHGGKSEPVMGEILSAYPRESFYLATKFPGDDLANMGKVKEIFPAQLERCRTPYFDFYLFHNLNEGNIDEYLNPENGILPYLLERKKEGKIKHLGFSAHGKIETMRRFLDAYGEHMEFCQIQLNWLDYHFQDAKGKLALLAEYNLPVFVMEPVRGGRLAVLADEYEKRLQAHRPTATAPEWAFRFLQSLPQVVMTLSGMSNFAQLRENIATYAEEKPLDGVEMQLLFDIADEMTAKTKLPCTACGYCLSKCVQELDIPWLISLYNEKLYSGGGFIPEMALRALPEEKKPSACLACRACETVCPQNIEIHKMMADFAARVRK